MDLTKGQVSLALIFVGWGLVMAGCTANGQPVGCARAYFVLGATAASPGNPFGPGSYYSRISFLAPGNQSLSAVTDGGANLDEVLVANSLRNSLVARTPLSVPCPEGRGRDVSRLRLELFDGAP